MQYNYYLADLEIQSFADKLYHEIQVNLTSLITMTHACLPYLGEEKSSAQVNVSSGLAIFPKADASIYCATNACSPQSQLISSLKAKNRNSFITILEDIPPQEGAVMITDRGKDKMTPKAVARRL